MAFEAAPTVFEDFLLLGSRTTSIPRQIWLDDPASATDDFINDNLPAVAHMHIGSQRAIGAQVLCTGLWAASGYPTLEITHRLAATLMATKIDDEIEANIVAPFPGVAVKLPDNLLMLEEHGQLSSASVLVFASYFHRDQNRFSWIMASQSTSSVFGLHMPQIGFSTSEYDDPNYTPNAGEIEHEEVDERSSELARRLILGLCLYLSDPSKLGQPRVLKKKPSRHERQRMPGQLPAVSQYTIGREIQLDSNVITAIREYVKHGRKAPAVQYIVRGHWKMQAHGRGRTERKLIHVEPYWRGPVDAPILTHSGMPAWVKGPKKD